jgi:hypothetical protein
MDKGIIRREGTYIIIIIISIHELTRVSTVLLKMLAA